MAEPYIQRAHKQIQVESWSNAAREILLRGYSEAGPFAESHTTNADRSRATDTYEVHGDPISVTARPLAVPVRRGECYVRVTLLLDGEPVKRLMAAYLTDGKTLTWPPGVHEGFTDGKGLLRTITGTNPAAGVEIGETVPTNALWRLRALYLILVSDGTVLNRGVALFFNDPTNAVFLSPEFVNQAATQTHYYRYAKDGERRSGTIATSQHLIPLPDIPLFQAWTITTATANLQAGDDFAAPILIVEEWIQE